MHKMNPGEFVLDHVFCCNPICTAVNNNQIYRGRTNVSATKYYIKLILIIKYCMQTTYIPYCAQHLMRNKGGLYCASLLQAACAILDSAQHHSFSELMNKEINELRA